MIIQCDNCKTRFKLADEKLKPSGVKVRCTSCKQVFTVSPPTPASEPETPPPTPETPVSPPAAENESPEISDEQGMDFGSFDMDEGSDSEPNGDLPDQSGQPTEEEETPDDEFGAFDMESDEIDEDSFASFDETGSDDIADSDLSLDGLDEELNPSPTQEEPTDDFDFDEGFEDFEGGDETSSEATDDFSFDDEDASFDSDVSIGGDLGTTFDMDDAGEEPLPDLDGAFDEDDAFATDDEAASIEFDMDESSPGEESDAFDDTDAFDFSNGEDSDEGFDAFGSDESDEMQDGDEFSFDDNDFDTGLEIETTEKSAEETVENPVSEPELPQQQFEEKAFQPKAEASSAPVTQKRKTSKGAVFLLFIILIGGGGYGGLGWFYQTYDPMELYTRVQEQFVGKPQVDPNSQLAIGNLSSYFVDNKTSGTLFVIEGIITNSYSLPRSAISVKGTVYDEQGKALREQIVFCGNQIERDKLATLSFNKIEESMNNQFGELLSNLNLKPGQKVPFTIVFKNLPQKVAEYSVIVADSRPGSND